MQGIRQDMAEKMQANYGLMNVKIRKEELLHITSQPAEIYFAEGDNLQILTNINQQNQQKVHLDIINNLMNRILAAQTENFTYQDTVFVSNVLRKLGIHDEKTFMKQVFSLQNEQKETNRLLQKYETNQEILKLLLHQEKEKEVSAAKEKEIIKEKEQRYYIHHEIYKRLEIGKIYQDIQSFSKHYTHESSRIYPGEMQVAEQVKVARSLLLQQIKSEITGREMPFYYLQQNRYEYLQEMTQEVVQELEEQISAAILLNLAEQTYVLRQKQIEENSHYWYSLSHSLFQTAENTWKRYEANLLERKHYSTKMNQVLEQITHTKHQEGDIINHVVETYNKILHQWKEEHEFKQNLLVPKEMREVGYPEISRRGDSYYLTQEEFWMNYLSKESTEEEPSENTITTEQLQKQFEIYQQQNLSVQKRIQEENRQQMNISGGSYHLTQEEFQMNYLSKEESEEEPSENTITTEQLQKQLEIYQQKNYENYQKIAQIERMQPVLKDRKVDRKKARMDALRALENPQEVLREYFLSDREDEVREEQRKTEKRIYEVFSEETKEIYRQFLARDSSKEHTFLQHIMEQPQESENVREIIQSVKQIENREEIYQAKQKEIENIKYRKPVITEDVRAEIQQHLLLWKQLQQYPESISQEEESFLQTSTRETLYTREIQLTDLKENIEKQIKRQQIETIVLEQNTQKEIRSQQIEFVHKVEQKFNSDEFLEELQMQSGKTIKTQQTEERTMQKEQVINQVVQESVNHIQTNRIEDIEEIVQQSVRRQLNNLSEQVYGKLEKKLQTERKRRGYF